MLLILQIYLSFTQWEQCAAVRAPKEQLGVRCLRHRIWSSQGSNGKSCGSQLTLSTPCATVTHVFCNVSSILWMYLYIFFYNYA